MWIRRDGSSLLSPLFRPHHGDYGQRFSDFPRCFDIILAPLNTLASSQFVPHKKYRQELQTYGKQIF